MGKTKWEKKVELSIFDLENDIRETADPKKKRYLQWQLIALKKFRKIGYHGIVGTGALMIFTAIAIVMAIFLAVTYYIIVFIAFIFALKWEKRRSETGIPYSKWNIFKNTISGPYFLYYYAKYT